MSQVSAEDVLRFWLGEVNDPPLAKAERWWKKDDAFDREIKERFEETLDRGTRGELSEWRKSPRGRLALVILFDQLSRNMFRGTPRSFAQDALAREVALDALDSGDQRVLTATETGFLLMPLMHAEDLALQRRGEADWSALRDAATDDAVRTDLEKSVKYAAMHRAIIERFGRFPHRNAILGRPSTKEEEEFLTQPGSSF
jgi:uncharacterized protein (DUF924 family)